MNFHTGIATLGKLLAATVTAKNSGAVTTGVSFTQVVAADLGTVGVGDLIFVEGAAVHDKGATAGATNMQLRQSAGIAVLAALHDLNHIASGLESQAPSSSLSLHSFGILRVTTAGTCTVELTIQSIGSDGSVSTGAGQIACYRFAAA